MVIQINPVVHISKPHDVPKCALAPLVRSVKNGNTLMAVYRLPPQEMEVLRNGPVVRVSFLDVRVPGGKVGSEEAKAGIVVVETDADGALVP